MASVSVEKRPNGKYLLRWRDESSIQKPDGTVRKVRRAKKKTFATRGAAMKAQAQAHLDIAETGRFVPTADRPTATMEALVLAYVHALRNSDFAPATLRHRDSMICAFLDFVGDDTPASEFSLSLLESFAAALPGDGRKRGTRYRKLNEAERLWEWGADRPELFPGIARSRRITGRRRGSISPPPPVVAIHSPTWAEVDRMICHLDQRVWHRRAALLQRFQGLRVSQALSLRWSDLDLDEGVLYLRAGTRGTKSAPTRALPLHPALAAELATWERDHALLLHRPDGRPWRGDAVVEPFRRAWTLAKVPVAKWDKPQVQDGSAGQRAHGRPSHAIRAAFENGLLRAGVRRGIASLLTGHALDPTTAAYVPVATPQASPFWNDAVEALSMVPNLGVADDG
jgi:integrase